MDYTKYVNLDNYNCAIKHPGGMYLREVAELGRRNGLREINGFYSVDDWEANYFSKIAEFVERIKRGELGAAGIIIGQNGNRHAVGLVFGKNGAYWIDSAGYS